MKPRLSLSLLPPVCLTVAAVVMLPMLNGDVLYEAQMRSLFMQGAQFWQDCMQLPGGLLRWAGCALTQLFCYPWLGSMTLLAMWLVTWALLRRTFLVGTAWQWLHVVPLFALLCSVIDLGYWLYYIKQPAYFFAPSLGLLCTVLLLDWRHRRWGWVMSLVAAAFYTLLGCWSVVVLVLRALRSGLGRQWANCIVALALAIVGPALMAPMYAGMRTEAAWTVGFPFIESNQSSSWLLTLPFYVVVASLAVMVILSWRSYRFGAGAEVHQQPARPLVTIAAFLALLGITWHCHVSDSNYHAELRITRAIREFRWTDILAEVDHAPVGPTRQMVVAKNLALLHTDHLQDLLFAFANSGPHPAVTDSLQVHIAQTAAPLFFLGHGMTNDAIRWSVENGGEYGFSVSDLRTMTLAAIAGGEMRVAAKYLQMLSLTWFHRDFVRRYYPLTQHPEWIGDYPELRRICQLHDDLQEFVIGDDGNVEWRIYQTFTNQLVHHCALANDAAIAYAMMRKEPQVFWPHLRSYSRLHPDATSMPIEYQEAAYLFTQLWPDEYPATDYRFDPDVTARWQSFWRLRQSLAQRRLTDQQQAETLQAQFAHTYWWFFFYCTDVSIY